MMIDTARVQNLTLLVDRNLYKSWICTKYLSSNIKTCPRMALDLFLKYSLILFLQTKVYFHRYVPSFFLKTYRVVVIFYH